MSYIIDRRENAGKKSTVNRQRFLKRYRKHIKEAVDGAIKDRSITDLERGGKVTIPRKDISEPVFHHGDSGIRHRVFPGNKEFSPGDEIQRPQGGSGGQGSGSGKASNQGEGEDEFTFNISQDEFLDFMFEDLELPYLVKKQLKNSTEFETRRAGFTQSGSPEKIHVIRSLKAAQARRVALSGSDRKLLRELHHELFEQENRLPDDTAAARVAQLHEEIEALKKKIARVPFIDDFDLRFSNMVKVPVPSSKAVMFCLMDVSGSMTQTIKDVAKRFFILLYLFLERNYKRIELVFIRHHTQAKEVDEQEFFYSRETGGTIVSSAIQMTADLIEERYPSNDWNVYVAQASDGDNWEGDSPICCDILDKRILPLCQYYAYIEITNGPRQNLWYEYEKLAESWAGTFNMKHLQSAADIYPVFRELFEKKAEGQV